MSKASVKSNNVNKYNQLSLAELETTIDNLRTKQKSSPSPQITQDLSAARFALQQLQHRIKASVMEFEQTNNRHLLFFNSTNDFVKIAGHSAIFFAMTIADRIHWRYSLKVDTDRYSTSEDGVISFRSLPSIAAKLAEINIYPDNSFTASKSISKPSSDSDNTDANISTELHYFLLPKTYSDEQIAKLRDNIQRDLERIMTIVLPSSPIPSLYDAIMQASQVIYYQFKHLSDSLARETIGRRMVASSYQMACEYLKYSNAKNKNRSQNLLNIIELSQELRNGIAYVSKLQILHHREVCQILEQLIAIERLASKAYLREQKGANS